ncbi:hypothetical protein Q1695_009709 [Nippostrongylus brasiliensis]|nr:hypothetical protein Q1695_009709 [Nippostrongylus brasiliensis]
MLFGRDPVLNIDLLIRHKTQQHVPSDADPSIYKESLVSSLHAVWSSVASYNKKRREAMKSIRPAPAVPIRRDNAPADFRSRFEGMHPWGCHLVDRPHFGPLSNDTVTSYLDAFVYKHVSQNGYFAARFVRSLFPRQFVGTPSVENPVPIPEAVRFVDTIAMRRQSEQVIEDLRNDTYVEDHLDVPRGPTGPPAASCAALSCTKLLNDDKTTRLVDASVPSLSSFPIRLVFELPNASADMGWNAHRPVDVWIVDSNTVLRMVIAQASYRFETRTLHVTLHTTISCHEHMRNLIDRFGRLQQRAVRVSACVRLGRLPIGTDPLFELLAEEEVFGTLHPSRDCRANAILNRLYDHRQAGANPDVAVPAQVPPAPMSVRLDNVPIDLRADQIHAVQMGDIDTPILAIQAAFGTGKTVVGALIAARLATADPEAIIVAMATTNGAVAQFTDTLLRLTDYRHLNVLRFVSDSALSDGCPQTAVDLHNILRQLPRDYRDQLSEAEFHTCQNYASCRQLVEIALFHPEQTMYLTEDQREDYRIAERENPEATEEAVEIMFRNAQLNTTASTRAA